MTVPDRKQLTVLMDGNRLGAVTEGAGGTGDRLELTYDDAWRANRYATPLSLSMPLAVQSHPDQVVRAYLWGLLPDNEQILDRWARRYQVSARNPFAMLRQVGEDCAGAAQFVRPEREDALLRREGGVDWLGEAEIADRLRTLRRDPSARLSSSATTAPAPGTGRSSGSTRRTCARRSGCLRPPSTRTTVVRARSRSRTCSGNGMRSGRRVGA